MAEIEKVEYEFPHEKEEKEAADNQKELPLESKAEEPEVEVVQEAAEPQTDEDYEDPKEVTDEELRRYSDKKLKDRLAHLGRGYHDEKRRAEAALKEKEEAIRIAQLIVEENKRLKGSLSKGQEALINQAKAATELEMEKAKRRFKEAYDAGDAEALAEAQEALTAAKIKSDRIANFKPTPLQEEEKSVETQQIAQATPPDTKALAWHQQNRWFGPDEEMTSFALGLHQKLVKSGINPRSDEYYERIDSRMRQVFPDAFNSPEESEQAERPARAIKSNVVAPATRSTASKKVTLSPTQVNIAKRLGVPLELYAKKVAEEARKTNG
jgi:hypothetical protein